MLLALHKTKCVSHALKTFDVCHCLAIIKKKKIILAQKKNWWLLGFTLKLKYTKINYCHLSILKVAN